MFINENYKNYKYVVGISDNYLILSNVSNVNASLVTPRTIDVVYQYLKPSFLTVEATRTFTTTADFSEIESSQSFFDRSDCNEIILSQFLIIFLIVFCINGLTRFCKKGGVFFGK